MKSLRDEIDKTLTKMLVREFQLPLGHNDKYDESLDKIVDAIMETIRENAT
jgi:hypothetical protein